MSLRFSLPLSVFLAITLIGCGDDSVADDLDAGPPPVDQCVGNGDQDLIAIIIADAGPDATGSAELGEFFSECALGSCLVPLINDQGLVECMNDCIDQTEIAPLSEGCRLCYIETVQCGQANCAVPCLGSDETACDACIDTHCDARLYACGGFE